ncbi:Arm DNA-binding domain-containing protein [Burkholderia diffusa]|nr:Arm DNA-binding domain-containing protein [Burkholderia diffusa]
MPLTDIKIRQAKAGDKPTKLTDGNGLYLEARPSGSKLWRYKYRIAGKENVFAIGDYPTISPQDARVARDDACELVKKGLHPSHARQEVLSARINEGKATFRAVSDEWLEKKRKTWTERHFGEILRMLEADAYAAVSVPRCTSCTHRARNREDRPGRRRTKHCLVPRRRGAFEPHFLTIYRIILSPTHIVHRPANSAGNRYSSSDS